MLTCTTGSDGFSISPFSTEAPRIKIHEIAVVDQAIASRPVQTRGVRRCVTVSKQSLRSFSIFAPVRNTSTTDEHTKRPQHGWTLTRHTVSGRALDKRAYKIHAFQRDVNSARGRTVQLVGKWGGCAANSSQRWRRPVNACSAHRSETNTKRFQPSTCKKHEIVSADESDWSSSLWWSARNGLSLLSYSHGADAFCVSPVCTHEHVLM